MAEKSFTRFSTNIMSEQIICLSDSEESVRSATNEVPNVRHWDDEIDFSFPPFECTDHVNEFTNVIDRKQKEKDVDTVFFQTTTRRKTVLRDDAITRISADPRFVNKLGERTKKTRKAEAPKESLVSKLISRNEAKEKEKETRGERVAKEKSLKAIERKKLKKIQPGECLKMMQVRLDRGLENFGFHLCIVDALLDSDISWELGTLPVANSIMWIQNSEEHYINDSNEICTKTIREVENQMIIIWNCEEVVGRVKEGSFVFAIKNMLNLVPDAQPTLVLYGMEEYFRDNKKGAKLHSRKNANDGCTSHKISRKDLEIGLAEIQLALNCNSQLVDTPEGLGSLLYRFTKSIADIPYKSEKRKNLVNKLEWYASGDNRDTVRVDKSSIGLKRLWQQQLCQFNLASLETAEAISLVYPSPLRLMEAYRNCTSDEGETLLKDIPIRRAAGPLSTVRKIGPELSKKIFVMFTSKDGESALGNEKEL